MKELVPTCLEFPNGPKCSGGNRNVFPAIKEGHFTKLSPGGMCQFSLDAHLTPDNHFSITQPNLCCYEWDLKGGSELRLRAVFEANLDRATEQQFGTLWTGKAFSSESAVTIETK